MPVECAKKVGAMCHFVFIILIIIINKSEMPLQINNGTAHGSGFVAMKEVAESGILQYLLEGVVSRSMRDCAPEICVVVEQ